MQADGQQFADDSRPCWAMALSLAGQGDLFDWVHCGGTMSENFAASIMQGLLSALRHIHLQGVCHRDVKPENVLLSNSRPLLCDFGVATRLSEVRKRPIHCGPAGFTAPEILLNMEPTTQSDVFSAGCVSLSFHGPTKLQASLVRFASLPASPSCSMCITSPGFSS